MHHIGLNFSIETLNKRQHQENQKSHWQHSDELQMFYLSWTKSFIIDWSISKRQHKGRNVGKSATKIIPSPSESFPKNSSVLEPDVFPNCCGLNWQLSNEHLGGNLFERSHQMHHLGSSFDIKTLIKGNTFIGQNNLRTQHRASDGNMLEVHFLLLILNVKMC